MDHAFGMAVQERTKEMRLVPNARRAWRWFSVQAFVAIGVLQAAWETLPPDALTVIPIDWRGYITLGLAIAGLVGRLIAQEPKE
jgi:multisubunit Na+/H+ antiporter MnhB subunit